MLCVLAHILQMQQEGTTIFMKNGTTLKHFDV